MVEKKTQAKPAVKSAPKDGVKKPLAKAHVAPKEAPSKAPVKKAEVKESVVKAPVTHAKVNAPTKVTPAPKKHEAKVEPQVHKAAPIKAHNATHHVKESTKSKAKTHVVLVKSKRKTAIARASAKSGKGRITINKVPYKIIQNIYLRSLVEEPIIVAENYSKGITSKLDIDVNVRGGGQVSQLFASRGAIAKAITEYFDDAKLKDAMLTYDRSLLVDDTRRKEAKKQLGRGARGKRQHSRR